MLFQLECRLYIDLNTPSILGQCVVHYQNMRHFQSDFLLLEDYFELMSEHHYSHTKSYALLSLLIDFCCLVFRKDVFRSIQGVIRRSCLEECLSGAITLCGPDLERVIHQEHLPLRFKSGNNYSI